MLNTFLKFINSVLHYVSFYDAQKSNFLLPLASVALLLFENNLELIFLTLLL